MKKIIYTIIILISALINQSCKDNITNYIDDPDELPSGKIITSNPSGILTFEEASLLKPGTKLKLRINRTATEVIEYDITFNGVYDFEEERLIMCTTPHNLPIGSGDSGSPILTEDGKVIGALCYGWEFAKNQFAARAIEDMLAIKTKQ